MAQHGIKKLVSIVSEEDPRQRMPQKAVHVLLNLCRADGGAQCIHCYMDVLLLTAADCKHAEHANLLVQLMDELHFELRPRTVSSK